MSWRGLAVLAVLAACGRPAPSSAPAPVVPLWQVREGGGLAPIEPGTRELALLDAAGCEDCHAEEHGEWAQSRHGLAWRNGIFQREYSEQPRAWCVNCHAPLAPQQEALAAGDSRLADQGVSCAACHVRRGALVSATRAAHSPHQTQIDPSFGGPAMCADCHQFNFPILRGGDGVALRQTRHPMQATVADFRAGPARDTPGGCLGCHGSPAGHAFRGGHELAMLQRALSASWCRSGDEVVIELANVGAGHRVPTGDLHRHFLARVWLPTAPEATFEAFFGRRFKLAADGGRETIWDSSLWPGQRRRFAVPLASLLPKEEAVGESDELSEGKDELLPGEEEGLEGASEARAVESTSTTLAASPALGPTSGAAVASAPVPHAMASAPTPAHVPVLTEPLSFEVTYVYTADEVPRPRRDPGEPTTAQVHRERARFDELPVCAARR